MSDEMEILGAQVVRELVGADGGGLDLNFALNAAGEVAQRGVNMYQQEEAKKKADAAAAAALTRALAADVAWADAEEMLDLVKKSGDAQRIAAAQSIAQAADAAAMQAGAGMPQSAIDKRVSAAQENATKAAREALSDANKQSKMRAWQKVAARAGFGGMSMSPSGKGGLSRSASSGNFFTRQYGGVPVWGWGLGAAGVLTGTILLVRALRKRR